MALSPAARAALLDVTTATLTTVLLKLGIRNAWLRGTRPLVSAARGRRIVGEAFTLRFIPVREDLATPQAWASPKSTRAAIEAMPEGAICVADARGVTDCGIFGDILCARMAKRQVAALVTDGALRDFAGVEACGLPVFAAGIAAPSSVTGLIFVDWQEPIGCGGCAIYPGDVIVADGDGAVVLPQAMLDQIVDTAVEQEKLETWIMQEVDRGLALPGLYPPNAETKARYEASRKK
jgi:regulator of RNase E activity RraA